jgi:hypothetical protein
MVNWIRQNKLATLLILILLLVVFKDNLPVFRTARLATKQVSYDQAGMEPAMAPLESIGSNFSLPISREVAPVQQEERLVVEQSSMSLVVAEVQKTAEKVMDYAKEVGGYMVSSSLTRPEEAPFATVVVRVPQDKFRETLEQFRKMAIRVASENILGTDVTSEYVDIEARVATLQKTKAKFESILEGATQVQDILQVQRELVNLQEQIDRLKGRQNYLEQTAKLSKITVYLSSDEFALPYVPAKPFRPETIFKQAVRSLVGSLRGLAKAGIWIGVYSVIWLPVLVIFLLVRKWRRGKPAGIK